MANTLLLFTFHDTKHIVTCISCFIKYHTTRPLIIRYNLRPALRDTLQFSIDKMADQDIYQHKTQRIVCDITNSVQQVLLRVLGMNGTFSYFRNILSEFCHLKLEYIENKQERKVIHSEYP